MYLFRQKSLPFSATLIIYHTFFADARKLFEKSELSEKNFTNSANSEKASDLFSLRDHTQILGGDAQVVQALSSKLDVIAFGNQRPGIPQGSIDIKNITDTPTDREIKVYYKNTENLAYFGGITYFLRVPAGLAPGETYNGYAANASTSRTEVMFVKYGN